MALIPVQMSGWREESGTMIVPYTCMNSGKKVGPLFYGDPLSGYFNGTL